MKIKAKELTKDKFAVYGQFNDMLDKASAGFGSDAFIFYRDSIRYAAATPVLGLSTLSVKRDENFQVMAMEYHTHTAEVMMPMDDDMILCIQKAGSEDEPTPEDIEAFIVPKHVMVHLNPGVWHYMPLPVNKEEVNVLIVLPERAYHNDLVSVDMSAKEVFIEI